MFDPVANTGSRQTYGLSLGAANKMFSGNLALNGKVYGVPGSGAETLALDFVAIPPLPASVCLHPALNKM